MVSSLERVPASTGASDAREVAQAMELVTQLRRDFAERDDLYKYVDDVLYGRINYRPPKNFRALTTARRNPLAIFYTNTITAALSVNPPATQFPVMGVGDAANTNATLREHFFDASWERQEEEAEAPVFRRFTHSVVCKGESALKTIPRSRTGWSEYASYSKELVRRLEQGDLKDLGYDEKDKLYDAKTEEYKKTVAPYPIRSTDVVPETFYYWKGEDGITLAVEHKQVPYLETLVRYGMGLDRDGRVVRLDTAAMGQALPPEDWRSAMSGASTLTMSEIWTHDRCRYVLSGPGQYGASESGKRGTLARSFRHRYGDPVTKSLRGPYAHCLGTTTASRLPQYAGLGVLFGYLDLFVLLDKMLSVQEINAVLTGLAAYKRNRPPNAGLSDSEYGEDGRMTTRQPLVVEPGAIIPDDIGPVEQPRGGEALPAFVGQIKEFLEQILPKVLQGVVDTTDSGYQLALAARLGRIAFDPMVSNIRRAAARRVGFESWLIEHEIGETVYAQGVPVTKAGQRKAPAAGVLAIGPDDLKGIHRYRVVLNPEDKASELTEVRKQAEMVSAGFTSKGDAIEALGGNAEEVELKILIEQYKAKPETLAALDQRVQQKLGALEQQAIQQGDQALAQAGAMPQPPQQTDPGAMLQGAGQVFEAGQTMPLEPGMPGVAPGVPANAPGGLPASIPGQPPGVPPPSQQVPSLGAIMGGPVA